MTDPAAHLAIERCLLSYTRGVDRLDPELIAGAFHPAAVLENYGPGPTTIEAFVERVVPALRDRFVATQHKVSNIAIEIAGDRASMESYVLAYHVEEDGSTTRLHTFAGRYIDTAERRDGHWRIAHRDLRNDWSKIETIDEPMGTHWVTSERDRTDPIYTALD